MTTEPSEPASDIWSLMTPPATCRKCKWTGKPEVRRTEAKARVALTALFFVLGVPLLLFEVPVISQLDSWWVVGPALVVWWGVPMVLRRLAKCPQCGTSLA